jgi:hypothetical protein
MSPEPRKGEEEQAFISRCIRIVRREGKPAKEAAGKCYGIWRNAKGIKEPDKKE